VSSFFGGTGAVMVGTGFPDVFRQFEQETPIQFNGVSYLLGNSN